MIKIIKVYKDSRILENGTLSTLGLGVRTDNEVDILRFKFDVLPNGVGTLLTTLKDNNNELVSFPLTRNEQENSLDLVITQALVSQLSITFQIQIVNETEIWNSLQATLKVHECLDIGEGEMPTSIENWLINANIILSGIENAETTRNNNENSRITNERLRVQAEDEREAYITNLKQRVDNGEFDGQDGVSAIISDATASIDSNIGTPSVDITLGGTDLDRTFAFEFHNLKGSKGDTGANGLDAKINGVNTLTIEEGQNITITQEGSTMTISSTGGGGGSTNYNDLSNKPSINNVTLQGNKTLTDLGIQPSGNYVTPSDLSTVATTGNYSDLNGKPTIPTKTSDLNNDSGFITNSVDNLTNYYTKSSTDTLLGNKEDKSNKVTSLSSSSTDTQYPSAKCVYDLVGDIETILTTLDIGSGV